MNLGRDNGLRFHEGRGLDLRWMSAGPEMGKAVCGTKRTGCLEL